MIRIMGTLFLILMFQSLAAPPSNSVVVFASEGMNPFDDLYQATCKVESNFNPFAVGDKHLREWSYGIVQIRKSRLDDYYRRTGIRYTTDDMLDPAKAKRVYMFYCSDFNPYEFEAISRSWNGGPDYRKKKQTRDYWWKVNKFLYRYKNQRKQ